jgi:DNA polymerase elongation subunit (family B)
VLLRQVEGVLPEGIALEFDGRFDAMFCYKSKNYALREGDKITVRGSALRSRGTEPFLKKLTDALIRFLLGAEGESPLAMVKKLREDLAGSRAPVELLAKSEVLGMNPEAYEAFVAGGGKPRRAAAEAALLMADRPRMGERVRFFIVAGEKGRTADWQRARPVEMFDADKLPYDARHYAGKLDDWLERYGAFLEGAAEAGRGLGGDGVRGDGGGVTRGQGELF